MLIGNVEAAQVICSNFCLRIDVSRCNAPGKHNKVGVAITIEGMSVVEPRPKRRGGSTIPLSCSQNDDGVRGGSFVLPGLVHDSQANEDEAEDNQDNKGCRK
jgi:hypothetical protein